MGIVDRQAVVQACKALLRPLAGFLLKCGMTWKEFADISKSVFVDVAGREYGIKGRKTNVSRVSILTGISRKEVKRQRELLEAEQSPLPGKTTDATRLLSGWYQDPDFLDAAGQPLDLPLEGDGISFELLWKRYGGDVPVSAMLKELERVGVVRKTAGGQLEVVSRYYMPVQFDTQWLLNAGSVFEDLGENINHNLVASDDNPSRFLGRATNHSIDERHWPAFREFLEAEGESFLERVDDWLTEHEAGGDTSDDKGRLRLGAGLFMIRGGSQDDTK